LWVGIVRCPAEVALAIDHTNPLPNAHDLAFSLLDVVLSRPLSGDRDAFNHCDDENNAENAIGL
jgi:hypothetical protein